MPKQTALCPTCRGDKWVVESINDGNAEVTEPCPTCKGNGFVYVEAKTPPKKKTAQLSAPAAGKAGG